MNDSGRTAIMDYFRREGVLSSDATPRHASTSDAAPLYSPGQPRVPVDRVAMTDEQVIAQAVAVGMFGYVMFDKRGNDDSTSKR